MTQRAVAVQVERGGRTELMEGVSVEAVVNAVRDAFGQRDVTFAITADSADDRLLVAVDGSDAFLGLEGADGVFQFVVTDFAVHQGSRAFVIGGQESDIEARYLSDIQTAATVVEGWLTGIEVTTLGFWEPQ